MNTRLFTTVGTAAGLSKGKKILRKYTFEQFQLEMKRVIATHLSSRLAAKSAVQKV